MSKHLVRLQNVLGDGRDWVYTGFCYIGENKKCVCGHNIKYVFVIKHKTSDELQELGSDCIQMFELANPDMVNKVQDHVKRMTANKDVVERNSWLVRASYKVVERSKPESTSDAFKGMLKSLMIGELDCRNFTKNQAAVFYVFFNRWVGPKAAKNYVNMLKGIGAKCYV